VSDLLQPLQSALADRYLIERELGRGGAAIVYLAEDRRHQRRVALKVLRPELAASIGGERFLREIRIAAQLSHPNILPLFDSGRVAAAPASSASAELLYYTMPYVEGESLRDRLNRENQLPIADALQIACEIADALGYAHEQGIVHRDVKPENILFRRGHAVVADFGIARAVTVAGAETLTETGIAVGTPAYMSPEQGVGNGEVDGRSDLYSLGCVLYEMLSGETPFTGPSAQSVMAKHAVATRPGVRTLRETVPISVEDAIRRAMAKSPTDRFPTAGAFAAELCRTDRRLLRVSPRGVWRGLLTAALLTAAALGVVGVRAWLVSPKRATSTRGVDILDPNRIAVLYFEDLSDDGSLGYMARGLTEDLIGELSAVDALHIMSPEGVRPFRNRAVPVDSIGRTLSVGSVVGGSVARVDDVLRVRVRLLDPATAEELFSRSFQDGIDDVFALQDRLADEVALFLRERLGREIVLRERRKRASSPAAWELVNRAEELADDGDSLVRVGRAEQAAVALRAGDSLAARAEALDSAWTGPALMRGRIAYAMAFTERSDPRWLDADWLERGLVHAERALRTDSLSAEALALRGELRYRLGAWTSDTRDSTLLARAEADLHRAVDLEPGLAGAWYIIGEAQYRDNRFREAKASLTTAYQADAYLTEARTVIQFLFSSSLEVEEFEDARQWCDTGRRRFPSDVRFVDCELTLLGWTGRGRQHIAHALDVLDQMTRSDSLGAFGPKPAFARMWIAALYARTGMAAEARAFIDSAQRVAGELGPTADVHHIEAYVRLLLGQSNESLRLLAEYAERHPEQRGFLSQCPLYRSLHSREEFARILVR